MPAAPAGAGSNCRQPLDFMLATLVGNGAAWSVASAGVEEPILEMERAVDEKAVHENPAQTSLSFYKRSALTKLASGRELGFLSFPIGAVPIITQRSVLIRQRISRPANDRLLIAFRNIRSCGA